MQYKVNNYTGCFINVIKQKKKPELSQQCVCGEVGDHACGYNVMFDPT